MIRLMRNLWGWVSGATRSRKRMARLWRRFRDGDASLRGLLTPDDAAEFPAVAGRILLEDALQSVRRNDGRRLRVDVEPLIDQAKKTTDWQRQAAQAVGSIVAMALRAPEPRRADALDLALTAYQDFRAESREPVPGAFALVEEVARCEGRDKRAVRAYIEYLCCLRNKGDDEVEAALRQACDPREKEAEPRNRLVQDVLARPWATRNLMQVYRERGDLASARKQLEEAPQARYHLDARADADWNFQAGLVRRALREWREAAEYFEKAAPALDAEERALAETFGIEARFQEQTARLHALADPVPILAAWKQWRDRLERACHAGVPPALPVLLALEQRLADPSAALKSLARFDPGASDPRELRLALTGLVLDSESVLADDLLGDVAGRPRADHVHHARRLLTRGRVRLFQDYENSLIGTGPGRLPADSPAARLLRADLLIRTGRAAQADPAWLTDAAARTAFPALAVRLRLERSLASGEPAQAQALLDTPEALHLPPRLRRVYRGEALLAEDWPTAWTLLREVAEADPDWPPALLALGLALLLLGQDATAADAFDRLRSVQHDNRYALVGAALARGELAALANQIRSDEPEVGELMRPWARRLAAGGRHDLAGELHHHFSI